MDTRLAEKDFEAFCEMLNQPMSKATVDLMTREEGWGRTSNPSLDPQKPENEEAFSVNAL